MVYGGEIFSQHELIELSFTAPVYHSFTSVCKSGGNHTVVCSKVLFIGISKVWSTWGHPKLPKILSRKVPHRNIFDRMTVQENLIAH
jgi:hypothetical protein